MNKHDVGGIIKNNIKLKTTSDNKVVINLLVQSQDKFTDKTGKIHTKRNIHQVELWDKTAKMVAENYKKGSYIIVSGRSETTKIDENNYSTKLIVNSVENINRKH